MKITLSHVVAISQNGIIGAGGKLPWRLASDMKRFKQITMGKPIIMGRKTFESIGRPLPGRSNIVITRSASYKKEGVHVAASVDEALEMGADIARKNEVNEICIIGGGEIYRQTLLRIERIYLTQVMAEIAGDTTYPELAEAEWQEVAREHHCKSADDTADFDIVTLERA